MIPQNLTTRCNYHIFFIYLGTKLDFFLKKLNCHRFTYLKT